MCEDGTVTGEPAEMGKAIVTHWKRVFSKKEIDEHLLMQWLEETRPQRTRECNLPDNQKVLEKSDPHDRSHSTRISVPLSL